jgi:hypothetical protein
LTKGTRSAKRWERLKNQTQYGPKASNDAPAAGSAAATNTTPAVDKAAKNTKGRGKKRKRDEAADEAADDEAGDDAANDAADEKPRFLRDHVVLKPMKTKPDTPMWPPFQMLAEAAAQVSSSPSSVPGAPSHHLPPVQGYQASLTGPGDHFNAGFNPQFLASPANAQPMAHQAYQGDLAAYINQGLHLQHAIGYAQATQSPSLAYQAPPRSHWGPRLPEEVVRVQQHGQGSARYQGYYQQSEDENVTED